MSSVASATQRDPSITQVPIHFAPELYKKQHDAIFCPERYSVIEASTKAGKTVGCLIWLAIRASQMGDGRNHWWVAPVSRQAKIAFDRLEAAMREYTDLGFKFNKNELSCYFPNGAKIFFMSADNPDTLYGDDVFSVVMDEASRMREAAWIAIRSTLTKTEGHARLIGNVKGRGNFFYKLARRAESGVANWKYSKLTAYDAVDAGVLNAAEIEDARLTLPPNAFKELYLAEAADDGGNPFGYDNILQCCKSKNDWPGHVKGSTEICSWGIDLAKSYDWTVAVGLSAEGTVLGYHRWQHTPWRDTVSRLKKILAPYPNAKVLVDSTGVGDPVLEMLQDTCINRYIEGYVFTSRSKQQLMEGLALSISKHEIAFSANKHELMLMELENIEYQYTKTGVYYGAPDGLHDDIVMALALADRARHMQPKRHRWGDLARDLDEAA